MVRAIALLTGVLLLLPIIVEDSYGHGIIAAKDCNKTNLPYNQELYKEDIVSINQAARLYIEGNPHYKMSGLASYMVNVYLNQPVEIAHCLRDLGINPSSVAQLSPLAYDALTYDKTNLHGYSHNFLAEIPAPQTNVEDTLPTQHQATNRQNERVETQNEPPPLGAIPAQAMKESVQNLESPTDKLQISSEYIFIAVAIASLAGVIILFTMKPKKESRLTVIPQRGF